MKKPKSDQQAADELLEQLQKTYLDQAPTDPSKEDPDDVAFRHKVADLFKKFAGGKNAKKKKTSRRKPESIVEEVPEPEADPEPVEEEKTEPVVEEEPEPIVEEEPEPVVEEEPEPIVEEEPEPIVEEEPEPIVEEEPEPIVEEEPEPVVEEEPEPIVEEEPEPIVEKEPEPVSVERIRIGQKQPPAPEPEPWAPPRVEARGKIAESPEPVVKRRGEEPVEPERKRPAENKKVKHSTDMNTKKESLPRAGTLDGNPSSEIPARAAEPLPEPDESSSEQAQDRAETEPREKAPAGEKGLSENDVEMILELGYGNELEKLVGPETYRKIRSDHARQTYQSENARYDGVFGYRGKEYSGKETRDRTLAAYLHDRKYLIVQLVATVACLFLLFLVDLSQWLDYFSATLADTHPYLFAGTGMFLLCAIAGIHWRRLYAGLRGLFRFAPTPDMPVTVLVSVVLIYDTIRLFNAKSDQLPALNLCVGFALLLCLICDFIRLTNEMRTFRLLSGDGEKTVLEPTEPVKRMMRQGNRNVKILNDEIDESLYRVRPAKETAGFFRRFSDTSAIERPAMILLILSCSLALIVGVVAAILAESVQIALTAIAFTFLLTLPNFFTLFRSLPLHIANTKLAEKGCALIGDESVEELSRPATLIFEDTDLFSARRTAQACLRQGDDFRQDLRLCEILFRKLDGTLGPIGRARSNGANDPPVLLLRIDEHGVEALVDGKNRILAGNAEFLSRYGISVPRESSDRQLRRSPKTTLLYVAIDGILKLHYEIVYQPDPAFEDLVRLLSGCQMTTAIRTYDPNLSDEFLKSVRSPDAPPVRVVKPGRYEDPTPPELSDTGAVSIAGGAVLVAPVRAARAIRRMRKIGFRILLASLLPGAALALCGALLLSASALPYFSLLILAWRGLIDLSCVFLDTGFLQSESIFGNSFDLFDTIDSI